MAEHEESRQTDEAGAAAAAAAVGEQDDLDALEQRIWKRFQEFDGFESYIATKQAIQMLLNSGLLQAANPKLATSTSIGTPELDSPDPSLSSSSSSFLGRESRVGSISGTSSSNRDLGESPYMVQSPTMMSSAAAAGGMLGQNYSPMSSLSSASTASSSGGGTQYFSNYPSYAASSSNTTLSSSSSIFSPPGMGSGHRSMSSSTSATTSTQRQQSTRRRRRFKILDAGCGKGTVTLLITVMALEGIILPLDEIEITAADLNREMLEDLQRRIHQNGWKHIKVRAFSLEHIPMPENTFHFIFCNIAMHWVQDEDSGLQGERRCLPFYGALLVLPMTPAEPLPPHFPQRLIASSDRVERLAW